MFATNLLVFLIHDKMKSVVINKFSIITFKLKKDGDKYHAFCPELKGCHTFGANPEEALKNLKNAVSLYLDDELEEQTFNSLIEDAKKNVKV